MLSQQRVRSLMQQDSHQGIQTLLLPRRSVASFEDLSPEELAVLKKFYVKLARLALTDDDVHASHSLGEAEGRHQVKRVRAGKARTRAPAADTAATVSEADKVNKADKADKTDNADKTDKPES